MSASPARTRAGAGAVALAVAGALFVAYPAMRPYHDETTAAGATTSMSSNAWVAAHLFAMIGFVLLPLGLLAITGVVGRTRPAGLTLAATVAVWIGAGLCLPYYGSEDFGLHAIAGSHGSQSNVVGLVDAVRTQPVALSTFGAGLVVLAIGAILAAVALWRSAVLPRWVGIPFAAALVLFLPQFYASPSVRIAHGVLMFVSLVLLAGALWRAAAQVADVSTTATEHRLPVAA
jgi:hypothetical protein